MRIATREYLQINSIFRRDDCKILVLKLPQISSPREIVGVTSAGKWRKYITQFPKEVPLIPLASRTIVSRTGKEFSVFRVDATSQDFRSCLCCYYYIGGHGESLEEQTGSICRQIVRSELLVSLYRAYSVNSGRFWTDARETRLRTGGFSVFHVYLRSTRLSHRTRPFLAGRILLP